MADFLAILHVLVFIDYTLLLSASKLSKGNYHTSNSLVTCDVKVRGIEKIISVFTVLFLDYEPFRAESFTVERGDRHVCLGSVFTTRGRFSSAITEAHAPSSACLL